MNATQEPRPLTLVERINTLREEMRNRRRRGEHCPAQGILKDDSDNNQKCIVCDMPYIERKCKYKCGEVKGKYSQFIICNYRPTPFD
jgi:hypothetical protein